MECGQGDSRKLLQVSGGPVVVANDKPLHILRQTQSKIHLPGIRFIHNVLVTWDVSQDCLLGADFLTSHGFVVDLKSSSALPRTAVLLQCGQRTSALFAGCLLGTRGFSGLERKNCCWLVLTIPFTLQYCWSS